MNNTSAWEIDFSLINGMMVGLEFPPTDEMDDDLLAACVIDFFIIRVAFLKWKIV